MERTQIKPGTIPEMSNFESKYWTQLEPLIFLRSIHERRLQPGQNVEQTQPNGGATLNIQIFKKKWAKKLTSHMLQFLALNSFTKYAYQNGKTLEQARTNSRTIWSNFQNFSFQERRREQTSHISQFGYDDDRNLTL